MRQYAFLVQYGKYSMVYKPLGVSRAAAFITLINTLGVKIINRPDFAVTAQG